MKPMRFFGLHMSPGVAEYREPGKDPYRIFINEDAIKEMDTTFDGLPVFVHHVDEVDFNDPKLREHADGFVVKSFYNKADGKHWAEFMVVSEKGYDAIVNKKWKLSNAYVPKEMRGGGQWHGVDYAKEIVRGEYEHLAIVPNPRYAESVILTPEQFKAYNDEKEIELSRLKNSKEKSMLKFWKRQAVENGADLEGMTVVLPKSKKEVTISELVIRNDEIEMKKDEPQMANGDHHVMVGEHKMKVNELVAKHMQACNELAELKKKHPVENMEADEEAKKKALELAAHEEAEMAAAKKNKEDEEAAEKKKNEEKAKEEEKKKNAAHFEALKNAEKTAVVPEVRVDLSEDKVARGKTRYGSN